MFDIVLQNVRTKNCLWVILSYDMYSNNDNNITYLYCAIYLFKGAYEIEKVRKERFIQIGYNMIQIYDGVLIVPTIITSFVME